MSTVIITSYPRLHLTLLDMNGSLGRINGGIGFSIDRPVWRLEFSRLDRRQTKSKVEGGSRTETARIASHLIRLRLEFGGGAMKAVVRRGVPAHVGLGSGTSLLMAVTEAFFVLNGMPYDERTIVAGSGRGHTSGIGVTTYFSGGFVFDIGHRLPDCELAGKRNISFAPSSASVTRGAPTVLLSSPMPAWDVLLLRMRRRGPSDAEERRFFDRVCPIPARDVERLSRVATMLAVPAVLESDLVGFSRAVRLIQERYWKRAEIAWFGPSLRHLMKRLDHACDATFGMSSLGPSLYCVTNDIESVERATVSMIDRRRWTVLRAKPRNSGRDIQIVSR